jgi:hypothetical protein
MSANLKIVQREWEECMKWIRKYMSAAESYEKGKDLAAISAQLGINYQTVYMWIVQGTKPRPLPDSVVDMLATRGVVGEDEITMLKRHDMIYPINTNNRQR